MLSEKERKAKDSLDSAAPTHCLFVESFASSSALLPSPPPQVCIPMADALTTSLYRCQNESETLAL